jgi:SAM-dependent methyltransferase
MSDDSGAKPEVRSRRITVMGRRRSRATGEIAPESEQHEEQADEDEASTSDLQGSSAFGTQELDPPPQIDDSDKTNPRVRAEDIAATLSRLTPEPEEPQTNPRIVLEAIPGIAAQRPAPSSVVMARSVVIGQSQIIGGSPPEDDDEDGPTTDPPPPDSTPAPRVSIPTPNMGRPSLSSMMGPALAAFEAEQAAARVTDDADDTIPLRPVSVDIEEPAVEEKPDSVVPVADLQSEPPIALSSDAPEPWVDLEEAEKTDPGAAVLQLEEVPEEDESEVRRANTPPPPPSEARVSHVPAQPPSTMKKPPPPPAAPAAAKPAEEEKKRKRVRQWWERFFSDDYLLTVPPPAAAQINKQVDFIEQSMGLAKGAMVLDVGCGLGLHAIELARRGYLVVGLDLSLAMITRAAETAQQQGLKINFLHADIREIAFDGAFDAVICMGTTFGFFDDDANRDVLNRLYQALRPGGRILLDVVNRDYVVRWQPNLVWFEGEGCVCMEESDFNYFNSRLVVKRTVMREDGQQNNSEYSLRAYSLHELGQLTQALGFRVIEVSGQEATRGVFFGNVSTRILMLAERRVQQRQSMVMPERSTGDMPRPPVTGEIPKPPPKKPE